MISRRAALAGLAALPLARQVHAASLTSTGVRESAQLAVARPDYPVPRDAGQLFYLHRSSNSNTVVYAANFRGDGSLDPRAPVKVYWRRFNTDGQAKALKSVERRFAYGVNARRGAAAGEFTVSLKPLPELPMTLRQAAPGQAEATMTIGGQPARPVYAYFTVDEAGLIPRITDFALYGYRRDTGRAIAETFRVTGGQIRQ